MHDILFQNHDALGTKDLRRYAQQLSLDTERFREELKNRTYEERVREDFRRGVINGVYGTPGLFINGVRHDGALDRDSLLRSIERNETEAYALFGVSIRTVWRDQSF